MLLGSELVSTLEEMAERHVLMTTNERDELSTRLVDEIKLELRGLLNPEALATLSKGLKIQYPFNRQFRENELAWLPDELKKRLASKFSQLDRLSSDAHQARTQAAYISGVLRPFNPKYLLRWFRERQDLNLSDVKARIERLEKAQIETIEALENWTEQVSELFKELVVATQDSAKNPLTRPAGQIAESSSRTYLQSWFAFIKKNGGQIIGVAESGLDQYGGPDLNQHVGPAVDQHEKLQIDALAKQPSPRMESGSPSTGTYSPAEVKGFLREAATELRALADQNQFLKTSVGGTTLEAMETVPSPQMPDLGDISEGLTIYAESPNGERSASNFGTFEGAQRGIGRWLKTLAYLWSQQPGLVKFDADLRLNGTQFRYSLPRWTLEDAEANLAEFTLSVFSESESRI